METPPPSTTCPKCAGPMEFGLLVDSTGPSPTSGAERVLEWVRGVPKKSWFYLSFKTGPGDRLKVATLRCKSCSYVELYAPDEHADTGTA